MDKGDLNVHEDASTLDVADRGREGRRKYPVVTEKPRAAPLPPLPGLRNCACAGGARAGPVRGGAWAVAGTELKARGAGLDGGGADWAGPRRIRIWLLSQFFCPAGHDPLLQNFLSFFLS